MTESKYPLANCGECPYKENTAFVPTQYPSMKPKIIVLGEAPGQQEAKTGIPFTGPSGELLNNVLKYHGLDREEVLLTNACLCRPYGPTETPPKAALAACATRLHYEIESSGADTIIAVGNTAAQAVIEGGGKISTLRVGPPKPYRNDPAIRVIPTWHPAYCLRSPDAFPAFVSDVGKVNGSKAPKWVEPEYRVFDDPDIAVQAIQALIDKAGPEIVIDIEVGVEKDFDYAHPEDYKMLCIGVAYASRKAVVFGENALKSEKVLEWFRKLFRKKKIIGHNGKFDLRGLSPLLGINKLWFDTMLAHYAMDERPGGHGLKVLAVERLGAPKYDDEIKKYLPKGSKKSYADIPRDILYHYNAMDVACTWALYELFLTEMDDRAKGVHEFLITASNTLIHLELNGIDFDVLYNKELSEEYLTEIDIYRQQIQDLVGYDINPNSPQQVTNYFLNQGIRVKDTSKDFLTEIRPRLDGEVGAFIDLLLKFRKAAKLHGTFIKGLAKRTTFGKVYTTYLLHGSTSGRLASRNPNMQNIVRNKRIRNQFTVEHDDNVLMQLDYKQAEGRVIATLARDEYLAGIFNDPTRDLFSEFCNDIFGEDNWGKEERVRIKSVFYGLAYGREARSIAHELDITVPEAQDLLSNFKALIPATVAWQAAVSKKVLDGEDLITPFGRKRSFYLITNDNRRDVLNEALSFLPQSTASDICLSALIRLRPMLEGIATVRLTIHDAIVVETHKERQEEVASIMQREMVGAGERFTDFCKFAVDVSVGTRLGEL